MTLIKRSDVKSHLSTGSGTSAHLRDSVNHPQSADPGGGGQAPAPQPDAAVAEPQASSPATEGNPAS